METSTKNASSLRCGKLPGTFVWKSCKTYGKSTTKNCLKLKMWKTTWAMFWKSCIKYGKNSKNCLGNKGARFARRFCWHFFVLFPFFLQFFQKMAQVVFHAFSWAGLLTEDAACGSSGPSRTPLDRLCVQCQKGALPALEKGRRFHTEQTM